MRFGFIAGDTSKTIYVRLRDSTTGLAKTGLAYNSSGAIASYTLPLAARAAITLATQTVTGAWSSGGFVEVDATNCPGLYRFDLPNAAIASGDFSIISITFTGVIQESIEIELFTPKANVTQWLGTACATPTVAGVPEVDITHLLGTAWLAPATAGTPDVNMKLAGGGTVANGAIPNAVAGAANGLVIAGTNAPITFTGSGSAFSCISTGGNGSGFVATGNGTGVGMKATGGATGSGFNIVGGATSGNGFDVTTTVGHGMILVAAGANKHGLVAFGGGASGTCDGIKGVAGTGGVPIRGDITGNITGDLSGSVGSVTGAVGSVTGAVGSVTGAVGSVTGNVGGNVAGSVGSVTGAVGSVTGAVGSVTGNVGGNVTGSVGSVATGGISASSFASGAIDAAALAADAGTEIGTAVWASATRTLTGFGTLIADIWTSFNATQFAKFFTVDSTKVYADAVAGSVVKEIADNASGGGGGSATVPQIIGGVTKSGSTYYVTYALLIDGAIVTSGLGTLSVTFYDEDGTDLTFSGTPAAGATGLIYASGTLTTPVTDNRPVMVKVAVTKDAVARSTFLPAVSIA